jgi:ligand-binding sensor domain-containing protein
MDLHQFGAALCPRRIDGVAMGGPIAMDLTVGLEGMSWMGAMIVRLFSVWRRWSSLALLVLATGMPETSAAQVEQAPVLEYRHIVRNYGPEDGFFQNTINALLQGQDGYLWIGTFGGLARFDGRQFTMMRATDGGSASLSPDDAGGPSSNRILALREDARGRIWIGTEDAGLSLYDHGRFQQLSICGGSCKVFSLSPQVGQTLWAATDAGLFRIATDSLRADVIKDRLPNHYNAVAVAKDGNVYVGGGKTGLGKVVGNDIEPLALPPGIASTAQIMEARGYIWAITNIGLYRFDPASRTWAPEVVGSVLRTLESSDGRLWIVTEAGQILRSDSAGKLQVVSGVPAMYANAIWHDRTGVLWIGSSNKGLWSLETSKAMTLETTQALAAYPGSGRAIVGDGAGGVWLGYGCGGVHHRLKDGTYETSRTRPVKKDLCVSSLLRDSDGALWIGTIDEGLQRIADKGLELLLRSSNFSSIQIWQADDGQYWLSGDGHTFNLSRTETGEYVLSPPVTALEGLNIRKMMMARNGGVWFIGDQGVVRLDKNKIVERWTPAEGLSSRFARSLYEDSRGVLWIGTYGGGLNRIENGRIIHYDEGNGLFDDTVSCILADKTGQMWLGGNRGISVLPSASQGELGFETVPFAVSTSAVTFELNGGMQSSCYQDENGHLWFALVSGFAKVDPAKLVEISAFQPKVHIERIVAANVKYDPRKPVVLGPAKQPLEIGYTAINLTSPDQLSFRYRISGADAQWTQAGAARNIIIYDVPWGEHVFEVQARNRGGLWSPAATFKISRPVPWYRYQWLWPLTAFLALLALMWGTRDPALSASRDQRLQRMSARKSTDQKEDYSGRL